MRIIFLCALFLSTINLFASSLSDRFGNAMDRCINNRRTYPEGDIRSIPREDLSHYTKSNLQAVLHPMFNGVFDQFGSVVQGMITGGDEAKVRPFLRFLAKEAKTVARRNNLNVRQQICIAGCITNQLMEANGDVNPYNSLELAIASGEGFCRHFTGSTKYLLDQMGIRTRSETAIDHIYSTFNHRGEKLIFDATVSDGKYDCFFYRAP